MNQALNIGSVFLHNSLEYPENTALWINGKSYSYRELRVRVLSIYDALSRSDNSEYRIAILCLPDVNTYASILAVSLYGAAYVPLNPEFPVERNLKMLELSGAKLVLNPGDLKGEFISNGFGVMNCQDLKPAKMNSSISDHFEIVQQDLAYILFTSGTTGTPKGVGIKKSNAAAFFKHFLNKSNYKFSPHDRFLQSFELTFDVSVFSFFMPLLIGASCHVVPSNGIKYLELIRLLKSNKITVAAIVPTVLQYILPFIDEINLPELKYSFFVGDKLLQSQCEAWTIAAPDSKLINLYGPTEATVGCTEYLWNKSDSEKEAQNGIIPIGKPFEDIDIVVLNENNEEAITGELCLAGEQVIENYLDGDQRDRFVTHLINGVPEQFYKTGDIVTLSSSGNLLFHGRKDTQVKLNGHRVELGEIEYYIRTIIDNPFVLKTYLTKSGINQLVLFVETGSDNSKLKEKIEAGMSKLVPSYMVPSKIFVIEKIPYNLNGKVDLTELEKIYTSLKTIK